MVAAPLVALAMTMAGQMLLIAAALMRLRSASPLAAALRAHAVVPAWAQTSGVATGIEVVQLAVGVAGLAVVLLGGTGSGLFAASCLATAVIFGAFACYLYAVLRTRGRVPCGCLGARERVRTSSIVRAAVFAIAPAGALAVDQSTGAGLTGVGWAGMGWAGMGVTGGGVGGVLTRLALAGVAAVIAAFAVHMVRVADALAPN